MKPTVVNRIAFITLAAAVILLLSLSYGSAQTPASTKTGPTTEPVTKEQRETIEKIIREYLLKNPSLIRDAMQALQAQEEKEKQERAANSMKELKSDIYSDPDSPIAGNPKGDVTIVVFFDYNCGYCKKSLPELQALLDKDPMLRVIYKEFPILGAQSQISATAALAAKRQGQYAAFNHALFAADGAGDGMIKGVSDRLKLNYAKLQQDMADPKLNEELERNMKLATALDINGTPAYIVGNQIIAGAIDMDALAKLVAAERAKLVTSRAPEIKAGSKQ
jgi:protein-disulfide isomerase